MELFRGISGVTAWAKMHEDPEMPNYGKRGRVFVEGMVVAIEPMINLGTKNIKQHKDGRSLLPTGKPSAHFEQQWLLWMENRKFYRRLLMFIRH
jgi:methionyl aminopeptidase